VVIVGLLIASAAYGDASRFPLFWRFTLALAEVLNAPAMNCWHFFQFCNLLLCAVLSGITFVNRSKVAGQYEALSEGAEIPLQVAAEDMMLEGRPKRPWNNKDLVGNISFAWVDEVVRLGSSRTLELEDCVLLTDVDTAEDAQQRITVNWELEKERAARRNSKPSILRAFNKTFWVEYFIYGGLLRMGRTVLNLISVGYLLPLLLNYIRNKSEGQNYLDGLLIALLLGVLNLITLVINHQFSITSTRTGLRMRSAYMTTVFAKALKLRNNHLPIGEIVNMVSNDTAKFADLALSTQNVWAGAIEVILTSALLYVTMGVSCLPGIFIIVRVLLTSSFLDFFFPLTSRLVSLRLLFVCDIFVLFQIAYFPLQGYIGGVIGKLKRTTMVEVDRRVRLMSEILTAIRLIKLYAWEPCERINFSFFLVFSNHK